MNTATVATTAAQQNAQQLLHTALERAQALARAVDELESAVYLLEGALDTWRENTEAAHDQKFRDSLRQAAHDVYHATNDGNLTDAEIEVASAYADAALGELEAAPRLERTHA